MLLIQVGHSQDLTQAHDFFVKQEDLYQRWLLQSGLGKVLKVQGVEVKSDELSLYLAFSFSDTDSVTAAWTQLKREFEANSPISLEQQLFYKMTHIMEVRQTLANVQLFDTYDLRENVCFFRGIKFNQEKGEVQVDSSGCKADLAPVTFNPTDFSDLKETANFEKKVATVKARFPSDTVFSRIYKYAENRYRLTYNLSDCQGRKPEVRPMEFSKNTLRFSVTDLCREVTNESNHWICDWLLKRFGRDCNYIQREKLIFTFHYEETPLGFKISGTVDGLFGSGYYNDVKPGGYTNMEEDPRFKALLEDYAKEVSRSVKDLF